MSEGIENIRGIDGIDGIDSVRQEVDAMEEADRRTADREAGAAELDLEAPEADSAEQRTDLLQQSDDPAPEGRADRDGEANPADTVEQRRVVGVDEEDYR
jgi:hypothetical protein